MLCKFSRIFPGIFLEDFSGHFFGQRLRGGGKTYRVNLGGGETYCRVCSPKPLLEASEIGVGLVGASFF